MDLNALDNIFGTPAPDDQKNKPTTAPSNKVSVSDQRLSSLDNIFSDDNTKPENTQRPVTTPNPTRQPKQYNTGFLGAINRFGNSITRRVKPVEKKVLHNVAETAKNIWNNDVQSVKDYAHSIISHDKNGKQSLVVYKHGSTLPGLINPNVPLGKAVAETTGKLGNVAGATIGTATAVAYPLPTFGLSAAEEVPGPIGGTAKIVNKGFGLLGTGGAAILRATVDALPMSDESKAELYPAADQIGAALGQFAGMALLHRTGKAVDTKLGVTERLGQIKAKLITVTQKFLTAKREHGIVGEDGQPEITAGDAKVIANNVVKEVPAKTPGTVNFTTPSGKIPVASDQSLVLQHFLKGREDVTYKRVKNLGTDPNGDPVQARFEWDYKRKTATIYVTENTTAGNLAHEIGHYFDRKLSLGIANRFSEIIPDYANNRQEVRDALTEYAVAGEPGRVGMADVTPRQISARVGKFVKNFNTDIGKLAEASGETRTTPSEQFASAVRTVLTKPEEAQATAPEFSSFIKFFSEKEGMIADVIKKAEKGMTIEGSSSEGKPAPKEEGGVGPLVAEARKYKSAEEFAKSKTLEPVENYSQPNATPIGTSKFYGKPGTVSPEDYGPVKTTALVDASKLYKGSSSYEYALNNGLLDKPLPQDLQKLTGLKTFKQVDDAFAEGVPDTIDGLTVSKQYKENPNIWYAVTQQIAEKDLRVKGFSGASWTHEDDLVPHQYQIWDNSAVKTKSQLTDIWKQAQKPSEAVQSPVLGKQPKTTEVPTLAEKPTVATEKQAKTTTVEGKFAGTGLKTSRTVENAPAFNPDKINASEDVITLTQGISKENDQFSKQRLSKTDPIVKRLAAEVNVTPEQLAKASPGSIANTETVFKSRQLMADMTKDLRDTVKSVDPANATPEELKVVKEKYLRLEGVMRAIAGFRTESSNIFRQFKMESRPGEFDIMRDLAFQLKKIDASAGDSIEAFTRGVSKDVSPTAISDLLITRRNGKPLTAKEVATVSEKAKLVNELEPATKGFENMIDNQAAVIKYLAAKNDLETYAHSLAPESRVKIATSTIGRGTMLFSLKSPLTNIIGNTVQGLMQAAERRFSSARFGGLAGDQANGFVKFMTDAYNKTGYDLTRMTKLDSTKKVLGEERVHSEGPGVVRRVGRFYEDWVFRRTQGLPDVVFSAVHVADSINLAASRIVAQEGLRGPAARTRAVELFKDATSLEPKTEEGTILRNQAISDAMYATYQNSGWASKMSLKIREAINHMSGDLRMGDLNIPFAKTPANVIAAGVESAGGGVVKSLASLVDALKKGKADDKVGQKDAVQSAVRGFVRTGVGLTAGFLIASTLGKDDFVGVFPTDKRERTLSQITGGGENMIKIGNKWVSLEYFGPLGPVVAGFMYAKKYGKTWPEKLQAYTAGAGSQLLRLPGINEVRNLSTGIQDQVALGMTVPEMVQQAKGDLIGFLRARTVPGIVNDVAQATDTNQRDTMGAPLGQFQATIPGYRKGLKEKVNILGEVQKTTGAGQLLFGARVKNVSDDPVKSLLVDNQLTISVPSKNTKIRLRSEKPTFEKGKPVGRPMTPDEYYNYVKYSGIEIKKQLSSRLSFIKDLPAERQQDRVNTVVDHVRAQVKRGLELGVYK